MRPIQKLLPLGLAFAFTLLATSALAQRGRGFAQVDTLTWRFLGPAVGNRIASIAGIPGDPTTYYAGAASGGIWKTTDGGDRWLPIFENQPVQAIGALAVSLADPAVVDELFLLTRPGHLQKLMGRRMKAGERDEFRASLVRGKLAGTKLNA